MLTQVFDCSKVRERTKGLDEAAAAIRRGGLAVLPTDTVYGVGADAFSPEAVEAMLTAKGRSRSMPSPVLISSKQMLGGLVDPVPEELSTLATKFWPGALTIIVRHSPHLAWDLGETKGTVALRIPADKLARDLIALTGPLAVSSANRTGNQPPTTMIDARLQLGASVAVYLDGGPSGKPVPSTMVDLTSEIPRMVRLGAVSFRRLKNSLPDMEDEVNG